MKKEITYIISGKRLEELSSIVPIAAHRYLHRASTEDQEMQFRFPQAAFDVLRELDALVIGAGLSRGFFVLLELGDEDLIADRLYSFAAPVLKGLRLPGEEVQEVSLCSICKYKLRRFRRGASPRLLMPSRPRFPIFRPEEGPGTIISESYAEELRAQGIFAGAELRPMSTPGMPEQFFLLGTSVDLGMPAGDLYADRCPECDLPRRGGGFYPIFKRPPQSSDVSFSMLHGEDVPLFSGRLAEELSRSVGADPIFKYLVRLGYYPDDQEDVRLPIQP